MTAHFNPNVGGLHQTKDVWFRDATFTDASGSANFTEEESDQLTDILTEIGYLFRELSAPVINKLATNSELTIPLQTFNNSKVRAGEQITNTSKHTAEFIGWIEDKYNKEIAALKRPEAKKNRETIKNTVVSFFRTNKNQIKIALDLHNLLAKAKAMIVAKLNNVRDIGTFLQTPNGFEVTAPEGFVAISHEGNATKLVDRLTFSHANFTATKQWTR
jgi:HD-GYP domain-containing protein (c-di-GMP phosphodiesterase class II)